VTKHDEVRQVLHDTQIVKFEDGRTALDMTDEEVEKFVAAFVTIMAEFGREVRTQIETAVISIGQAVGPYRADLDRALSAMERLHQ